MNCRICQMNEIGIQDIKRVHVLYYPLMSKEACIVYSILCDLKKEMSQADLEVLCGLSATQFLKARKQLEQFHLLRTYQNSSTWLYQVYAPLTDHEFLTHDTYGRMLLNTVGSSRFDQIKYLLSMEDGKEEDMKEVSEEIDLSSLDQWTQKKEDKYVSLLPKKDSFEKYDFNFDVFLSGLDNIFPARLRTPENLSKIAELATIHGIDEKEMKKYVNRAVNTQTKVFDYDKLKRLVLGNQRTSKKKVKSKYDMAPVQFMASLSNGAPVSTAERQLIERLMTEFGLNKEVVNVLIEYVLKMKNQKFPKRYVETIAASWKRLGIDSVEKAMKQITPKQKPKKNDLPDWYKDTSTEKASDEMMQMVLEQQKKLKGAGS